MNDFCNAFLDEDMIPLIEYIEHFKVNFALLLRRYKRYKEIDKKGTSNAIDAITYLDMIVVQLRAMCVENDRYKNNYTAQILLRKVGEDKLAQKIDDMLKTDFYDGSLRVDVRTALKILADEFICHYDNFDGEKQHRLSLADIFMNRLRSPYETINLDYIMEVLIDSICDGLKTKLKSTED